MERIRTQVRVVEVGPEEDGRKLLSFLEARLGRLPSGLYMRLVRSGQIRLDGRRSTSPQGFPCIPERAGRTPCTAGWMPGSPAPSPCTGWTGIPPDCCCAPKPTGFCGPCTPSGIW